jgi:hypothetical protein
MARPKKSDDGPVDVKKHAQIRNKTVVSFAKEECPVLRS